MNLDKKSRGNDALNRTIPQTCLRFRVLSFEVYAEDPSKFVEIVEAESRAIRCTNMNIYTYTYVYIYTHHTHKLGAKCEVTTNVLIFFGPYHIQVGLIVLI